MKTIRLCTVRLLVLGALGAAICGTVKGEEY